MVLESLMKFLTDKCGESAGFVRGERESTHSPTWILIVHRWQAPTPRDRARSKGWSPP